MTTEAYKRDHEAQNVVSLMNMFYDEALQLWDPKAPAGDQNRTRLERIFASKSMMACAELLRDAVVGKLDLIERRSGYARFYRKLSEEDVARVRATVRRLLQWEDGTRPRPTRRERSVRQ